MVCDVEGIHLYHIPELSSAEGSSVLGPCLGVVGGIQGVPRKCLHEVLPTPHALCPRGIGNSPSLCAYIDAPGRDLVLAKHHINGELPVHLSFREGDGIPSLMKGRRGLYWEITEPGAYLFGTCLLGRAYGFGAGVN